MADLVARLRKIAGHELDHMAAEAADELERLQRQVELLNAHPPLLVSADSVTPLLGASDDEIEALEEQLETERMRLAGCGVAAMADTPDTVAQRLTRDSPYWSASYGDVCRMVDRLMELRAALEKIAKPSVRGLVRSTNDLEHIAREALRDVVETTPSLNCPKCGLLYSGRGGQWGLPIMLTCPNGHTWADPRGGCNS